MLYPLIPEHRCKYACTFASIFQPLLEDMMLASYPPIRLVGICGASEQTLHRDPQPLIILQHFTKAIGKLLSV